MVKFKKSDLVFISKLGIDLELTAFKRHNKKKTNKPYWVLKIKADRGDTKKEGFLYGTRGEIRKFYQLNALVDVCIQYAGNCEKLIVIL